MQKIARELNLTETASVLPATITSSPKTEARLTNR
jgi:predicted PhzF superfamily epimerase YddE/YHI9